MFRYLVAIVTGLFLALNGYAGDTAAERDFKANGPRLYDMDTALKVSAQTGRPVVCWMGPHIFADARARERSMELADTTVQAVMDSDGETRDAKGNPLPVHRVKFSDGSYGKGSRIAFIAVDKLDETSAKKILSFTRGGRK